MIHYLRSVNELAEHISEAFLHFLREATGYKENICIALSGGSTPRKFFEQVALRHNTLDQPIPWNKVHFFWVDERCVTPDHADSNYGMTHKSMLHSLNLNSIQVHRIIGENDPHMEAIRYAGEIKQHVGLVDGMPVFDWIFLGIGEDGHTASIFPEQFDLLTSEQLCTAVRHPVSGQYRITLTGRPILEAKRVTFLVSGNSKSDIVRQILNNEVAASGYPAAYILRNHQYVDLLMDYEAAKQIKRPW